MGDIAGMNRFENLALTVQKDLDLVRYSKRKKFPLPKFHYEKRSFNIVHCNTDLTDNELEIVVVRGLNYNVPNPKDVDTYVKVEFPLLNVSIRSVHIYEKYPDIMYNFLFLGRII